MQQRLAILEKNRPLADALETLTISHVRSAIYNKRTKTELMTMDDLMVGLVRLARAYKFSRVVNAMNQSTPWLGVFAPRVLDLVIARMPKVLSASGKYYVGVAGSQLLL